MGVFGILGIISAIQALSFVQGALVVVVLIGAVFAVIHAGSLIYVGFEAFMIWRLCGSNGGASAGKDTAATTRKQATTGEVNVVGAAQTVGGPVADIEAAQTKTEA